MGRFAQADNIIPGGVQGWDRYAYVSNNPIKLIDPSGRKCVGDANECTALVGPIDIPLTHKGDPIPGSKKTVAFGGAAVYDIFRDYQTTCGWWNDDCNANFGIEEFLGMWALFESNNNPDAAGVISTIIAQNLFVGGNNPAACHRTCFNGVFNFMAAYSRGGGALFQGPQSDWVANFGKYVPAWERVKPLRTWISDLGSKAYGPSSVVSWDRRTGPSNWGNVQGGVGSWLAAVRNAQIEERNINGLAENTIYFYFGNAFYYSIAQKEFWTSNGATANMTENGEIVP